MIASSQNTFQPNGVFAWMVIIAVIALVAEGIRPLERRVLGWRPRSATEPGAV